MKIKTVILWSIGMAVIIFAVFVMPFLVWNNQASTPLNVWVVDKTVPDTSYKEHKGDVGVEQ